jgi:hypothetical protein
VLGYILGDLKKISSGHTEGDTSFSATVSRRENIRDPLWLSEHTYVGTYLRVIKIDD